MRGRSLAVAAAALISAACGEGPSGSAPRLATAAPDPEPRFVGPPRHASLRFDVRGRPFPLPIVSGTIGGHPTLMLLDTGANSHVIAGWFARKLKLPMRRLGDVGTDHVGRPLLAYRVERPEIAIDEWGPVAKTTVLATDVPEVLEQLGIGAFVSPQWLEEDGSAVVLDFRRGELRSAPWRESRSSLARDGTALIETEGVHVCQDDGPAKGLAYVVPAEIEHEPVHLLVDTGAQRSDLFATSSAGARLSEHGSSPAEPLYTASGKVTGRQVRNARVGAGSFATTTTVNLVQGKADPSCPRDGVLGMDVLRACTLLFGRAKIYARCDR
jgi:predicted aspartyl protease